MRIPDLQFSPISALSWVHIKYINMVTSRYLFHTHRMFIGDYPGPLWSHGATHKTGSHTPNAGCLTHSGVAHAGPRHWPPAGSPPPAPLPSHTLWIFLYPVCLMADTRQPASHPSAKRSRGLQSGRRRTCTAPATDPEHVPGPRPYSHTGWLSHAWMPPDGDRAGAAGRGSHARPGKSPLSAGARHRPAAGRPRVPVNGRRARS